MSGRNSDPPRLAVWLLERACTGDKEALMGDLIEKFRTGRTGVWFWRQTIVASVLCLLSRIWHYWPYICYAFAGISVTVLIGDTISQHQRAFKHWLGFPFPFSGVVFELGAYMLVVFAALPALAVGLLACGAYRWGSLIRTAMISIALLALHPYLLDYVSVAGRLTQDLWHVVMLAFFVTLFFFILFISAWLGCRSRELMKTQDLETRPTLSD